MAEQPHLNLEHKTAMTVGRLPDEPEARVGALAENGDIVPMPDTMPVYGRTVLDHGSLFDIVEAADHPVVHEAFRRATRTGVGAGTVHLSDNPARAVNLRITDLRSHVGVFLGVLLPGMADRQPPAPYGTVSFNLGGEILNCDDGFTGMLGWTPDHVRGQLALQGVHVDDQVQVADAWVEMLAAGRARPVRARMLHADGSWRWVEIYNRIDDTDPNRILGHLVDVRDEVATEEALHAQELLLNRLAQAVPVGLFQVGLDDRIVYANDRLHDILGTDRTTTLAGQLATLVPEDAPRLTATLDTVRSSGRDAEIEVEVRRPRHDGTAWNGTRFEPRRCQVSLRALTDRAGAITGAIACVSDVTESARQRVELERELVNRASHDQLTGMANRSLLLNRMRDALTRAKPNGDPVAILLADLDGFKEINDSLGHSVGDELLRAVSDRLRTLLRGDDSAARVGGDEFIILMENYIDPRHPQVVAEQVLAALAQPFAIKGRSLRIGVSIGISTSATAPGTEELLRDADLAMYRAKAGGRGRFETFAPEMHEMLVARMDLEAHLRRSLDANELVVYYQPIHDIHTGAITSAEALVRWCHPTRGLVAPAAFVPLAEETGLIVPIGRWVLDQACAEAASWPTLPGLTAPQISVNLSARQLTSPTLVHDVEAALANAGLDASRLVLEITESVAMEHSGRNVRVLGRLRELGVQLAIDDFGTGYSSLAYLQQLPVDILKIDKVFIDRIAEGGRHRALIKGILTLSESLSLRTIAEGIETTEQLQALTELHCGSGQGYLYSRPVETDAFRRYLETSRDSIILRS